VPAAPFLIQREQLEQHSTHDRVHARRFAELCEAFAGPLLGIVVEDLQRAEQQLIAGAEVVLQQPGGNPGLRGDLPQSDVFQATAGG
jgi:hypothetical protein